MKIQGVSDRERIGLGRVTKAISVIIKLIYAKDVVSNASQVFEKKKRGKVSL